MRILIVDDEEHLRRMMRLTLETAGYEVEAASDGETALAAFGDGRRFDATVLDQRMPRMDGLEVLRRMKAIRGDAPIVMATAYGTIELAVDAMKLGAADFVRKPMTPDTLRQSVAAALSRAGGPAPAAPTAVMDAGAQVASAEIWTTNGFFVSHAGGSAATEAGEHRFLVRRGSDSKGSEVVVRIEPAAVAEVEAATGTALAANGAFWRRQAETALVNHLWTDAALPEHGRLVIRRPSVETVNAAFEWKDH